MPARRERRWKPEQSVVLAHAACLCLGAGMVLWGLAPALVERAVIGRPPAAATQVSAWLLMVGGAFLGLHLLVRRSIAWATWAAFVLSTVLTGAGLAATIAVGGWLTSSFLLLLSAGTCFATWLAIGALPQRSAQLSTQPTAADAGTRTDGP